MTGRTAPAVADKFRADQRGAGQTDGAVQACQIWKFQADKYEPGRTVHSVGVQSVQCGAEQVVQSGAVQAGKSSAVNTVSVAFKAFWSSAEQAVQAGKSSVVQTVKDGAFQTVQLPDEERDTFKENEKLRLKGGVNI